MAAIEVLIGSPSWGMEIMCMQMRNTSTRVYGLYMIRHCMAIMAQYSKTLATKGYNTLLPHILDVFCQELTKTVVFQVYSFA